MSLTKKILKTSGSLLVGGLLTTIGCGCVGFLFALNYSDFNLKTKASLGISIGVGGVGCLFYGGVHLKKTYTNIKEFIRESYNNDNKFLLF